MPSDTDDGAAVGRARAEHLLELDRPAEARELAIAAAQADPDDEWGLRLVGAAESALGHGPAARAALERAVALAPHSWQAQVALAGAQAKVKRLRGQAAASARRAVEIAPDEAAALNDLGRVGLASSDVRGAVAGFTQASVARRVSACTRATFGWQR